MVRKSTIYHVFLAVVTLLAITGGFISFQRKRSSFERLDFQSHRQSGVIAVDDVDRGSNAERAGLRKGDAVLAIDGTPASEVDSYRRALRKVSSPVRLVIARDAHVMILSYVAPELKVDYQYLFLSFIGFLYLAIGLYTFIRGAGRESSLFYLVALLAFIVYVYTPGGRVDSTFKILTVIEEIARILLPALSLHFFLRFPRTLFRSRWILAAIYFPPLLIGLWDADLLLFANAIPIASVAQSFQLIDRWEMLHFAIYFTLSFIALTYTYRTAPAAGQKKQIKWIYLGTSIGFIPFLVLYLIPFVLKGAGAGYSTLAVLPLAFIPLAFAVSILKYKLWDVEVLIKEILAYTVTFLFGILAFSTVNLLLSRLVEDSLALEKNFLAFTSGLLIAAVLVPVKGKIETLLEMVLYRDTYRHRRAISEFAQELGAVRDLPELLEAIRDRLDAAIRLNRMNLYVLDGGSLVAYSPESTLPRRIDPLEARKLPAGRHLVLDSPRLPDASDLPMTLLRAGYRYVFPLRHSDELQGLLLFGNKEGEEPLSRDDLQLISSLTSPLALAIENARLYGRLRRQLEEIRSLKEYNENIIESSSSAIVVVARDGTILTANRAFWDLVGVEPDCEEALGVLFPPYRTMPHVTGSAEEQHFVNRKGIARDVAITASAFRASDAPDGTTVLVIGDISDRVRLEHELQDKERLAALGLLAAGVAHEVNTPLTGISSYAQLLLADMELDDPRYSVLKKMEQQTFRASHLVNNLLNFAARTEPVRECVSVSELTRATASLHEDLLRARGIKLHLSGPDDLEVSGNLHELQQVLTNLLLNARDAIRHVRDDPGAPGREVGGNIWIDWTRAGATDARIDVRDDGCGIPLELQSRIFEPLVTTKRAQGGTGLGLAITQKIIDSLGGKILLESEPGKGATFSVILPLWLAAAGPAVHGEPC